MRWRIADGNEVAFRHRGSGFVQLRLAIVREVVLAGNATIQPSLVIAIMAFGSKHEIVVLPLGSHADFRGQIFSDDFSVARHVRMNENAGTIHRRSSSSFAGVIVSKTGRASG